MQRGERNIIIFLVATTIIILLLAGLIFSLVFLYQKKQQAYRQKLNELKLDHEKNVMATKLEIQESTFQHISREIHDNINLSLTLVKLHLNTINWENLERTAFQIGSSISLLSDSIINLSNISKSLNSDIIKSQGLIIALEAEIQRIRASKILTIELRIIGEPVYMDTQKELLIFRIIQEAFNNIIKHSKAENAKLTLDYGFDHLKLSIIDNGEGFLNPCEEILKKSEKAGLKNMATRAKMIGGEMKIDSKINQGTSLYFNIPLI